MDARSNKATGSETHRAVRGEGNRATGSGRRNPPTATRHIDDAVSSIAAAIGEPARTRMLYSLMDGHARTATELAFAAEVSPSTASVHLSRLTAENLIKVQV
jgi:hypothetical protein